MSVILLVEDNASDEKLTLLALADCGVANEVVVARDGAAALDYLFGTGEHAGRDTSTPPQLILLDLKLPRIDGLDVLRRLRSDPRTAIVPIVILTASKEDEDIVRGYALGANAYIRKPVDFEAFRSATKALGLFWLLWNEPPPSLASGS
jgi:two-component system response regulator